MEKIEFSTDICYLPIPKRLDFKLSGSKLICLTYDLLYYNRDCM